MRAIYTKDDYTGFTYAGIHSSQFGLFSVTQNNRYQRELSPEFSEITQVINGSDGTVYFGSTDTKRSFNLQIAFDSVTESELREIRSWLTSGIQELIFDELPYIKYYAKIAQQPKVAFIAFTENGQRIYKGELPINFVCYDPYGYSVSKWLNDYGSIGPWGAQPTWLYTTNVEEWMDSSKLQRSQHNLLGDFDIYDSEKQKILLYNGGDMPCDYVLRFTTSSNAVISILNQDNYSLNAEGSEFEYESQMGFIHENAVKLLRIAAKGTGQQTFENIAVEIDTKKQLVMLKSNGITCVGNDSVIGDWRKITPSNNINDFRHMLFDVPVTNVSIEYEYKYY